MVWDPSRQRVVLLWDGAAWTERLPTTAPPPRSGHRLAWNPSRQRIALFGGSAANHRSRRVGEGRVTRPRARLD
jgi:hypothetical protein